jgi:hypothetical protein
VAIYVDDAIWPHRGHRWCHCISDQSLDELHAFAATLGWPRSRFQGDHYDLPADVRDRAVALGARPVSSRELVGRLRSSGLRRRPRRLGFGPSGGE